MGTEESKKIWEENAQFWDNAMGDESNEFHREVVRPKVTELLSPNPADYILDIACGKTIWGTQFTASPIPITIWSKRESSVTKASLSM